MARFQWQNSAHLGNSGDGGSQGRSMRALLKVGLAAGFATIMLCGNASISPAQKADEADALTKRILELYNAGRYADAIPMAQQVLAIREKALGPDHPQVATALGWLAALHDRQGRHAEAEPLYQRSLAIRERALGRDHPEVAKSLNNLALLYGNQGRYADAEPLYQRSLAIWEKALGPDHPEVARSLNNLAGLYSNQGRYAEAEPLYQRSLAVREKALGRDHPDVARALNNLAELYSSQGRYADAEPLYRRSLAIWEKALGPDHPDVATALNNLAQRYRNQGRYADAEPLCQRSLAIREKTLGRDHPDVAGSLNNLAGLYREQGRYAEAEQLYQRSLAVREKALGRDHPAVAASLNGLAEVYRNQGRYTDAEPLYQRSLAIREKAPGPNHPDVAESLNNLALLYDSQGRHADAEPLHRRFIGYFGKGAWSRSSLCRSGAEQCSQGRYADAEALYQRSLAITEKAFGPDHPHVAVLLNNLASLYGYQGRRALRAWLTDPRKRFDPELSFKIYQATFGAFADKITAKQRLSIVTNGALTSLPPQLLVANDPSGKNLKELDWLIRSHAVTVLPSVASLKILRSGSQASSARKPMIAFADPVFSKTARAQQLAMRSITSFYRGTQVDVAAIGEYLSQLPGTRREAQQIAADLNADDADIKLGLAATETAVKQAKLDQYRIVYFATHGLVAGDLETFAKDKAEAALALSIPDKPNDFDDGFLMASEIAQLKLDADWAVLSACNTAAEDKPGAEALSGLARAFFYAGARSLIVSHWSVSDEATARLMIGTFRASTPMRPHVRCRWKQT
jgi:CHAT domain-containing protein